MSDTLITSNDPKGRHATDLFRSAYDNACLDDKRAQRLNEHGGDLQKGIGELIARITVEEGSLEELILDLKLHRVHLRPEEFPPQPEDRDCRREYKLFPYKEGHGHRTEDIINRLIRKNYPPATVREMLKYAIRYWDGRSRIIALGSVASSKFDFRADVPVLNCINGVRTLDSKDFKYACSRGISYCLGVRRS